MKELIELLNEISHAAPVPGWRDDYEILTAFICTENYEAACREFANMDEAARRYMHDYYIVAAS